mgnify:CR=1 FL=1
MNILVRDISGSAYTFDKDSWALRCAHDLVQIDEYGTAWCPTCKNADMTDGDADRALDNKQTEDFERIYDHE